jgi:ATP phosphoribosyltransferase regulatory subunit
MESATIEAALIERLAGEGFARVEPALLQPAGVFASFAGEAWMQRLYLVEGEAGRGLCLRPEFTIPLSLDYLGSGRDLPADLFALGPVFRRRPGAPGEFRQLSVERFGHAEPDIEDAACLRLASDLLSVAGVPSPAFDIGDLALLNAVLDALSIRGAARRRTLRAIASGRVEAAALATPPRGERLMRLARDVARRDPADAEALLADLAGADVGPLAGREAADIRARLVAIAEEHAGPAPRFEALADYLAVEGDPDAAVEALRAVSARHGLDLSSGLSLFESRIGFIAAQGVDPGRLRFSARLVRPLDYYTGFVFEAGSGVAGKPLLGGGRYDALMRRLGAERDVPAIGFALWLERVPGGGAAP